MTFRGLTLPALVGPDAELIEVKGVAPSTGMMGKVLDWGILKMIVLLPAGLIAIVASALPNWLAYVWFALIGFYVLASQVVPILEVEVTKGFGESEPA